MPMGRVELSTRSGWSSTQHGWCPVQERPTKIFDLVDRAYPDSTATYWAFLKSDQAHTHQRPSPGSDPSRSSIGAIMDDIRDVYKIIQI